MNDGFFVVLNEFWWLPKKIWHPFCWIMWGGWSEILDFTSWCESDEAILRSVVHRSFKNREGVECFLLLLLRGEEKNVSSFIYNKKIVLLVAQKNDFFPHLNQSQHSGYEVNNGFAHYFLCTLCFSSILILCLSFTIAVWHLYVQVLHYSSATNPSCLPVHHNLKSSLFVFITWLENQSSFCLSDSPIC